MAVKRDYGSFSRAATRLLASSVAQFGFTPEVGTSFCRPREGWNDSFFLQQSAYGSGDFCVNVGVAVPALSESWQLPSAVGGLIIAWRLSDRATEDGGDCWYHAKDKVQLTTSLERVAKNLERALPWFEQFQSYRDVTEGFRTRSGISPRIEEYPLDAYPTFAMNYAFLLALGGNVREARDWLSVAHSRATMSRYWDPVNRRILAEQRQGTQAMRPTEEDRKRVSIVEAAMKRLAE